jgi:uncharacterized protein YfaS (alpha-2-macroglobulin family)
MSEVDVERRTDQALVTGNVRATNGNPVAGAQIVLIDGAGNETGRTSSADDGAFRLPAPRQERCLLLITASGHQPAMDLVEPARTTTPRTIWLERHNSRIRGVVRERRFGRPVRDASVALVDEHGIVVHTVATGADGRYEFPALPAGTYSLVVSSPAPAARSTRLPAGVRSELDLSLTDPRLG